MENKIEYYIKCLSCMINQEISKNIEDLSWPQSFLISFLYKRGSSVRQNELEKVFKTRRSSITSLIQSLEKDNYVIRESIETDKRLKEVILTEKGINKAKEITKIIENCESKLTNGLDSDELLALDNLLNKLINNLKEIN